ncbi:Oncoprotein-induced transcript 3 protein [Stylophora pistillata]|uniref:Oncoprotein-induced transcript 3 protein n=1 Tax=Stylophora pistillata TaxID=50429 RepID=A0A2B4S2U3_STYPI|nr:Oncoprotein-induced transcript 3 protein [Stylophora pistillata]
MPNKVIWIGLYRNPRVKSRWLWVDGSQASYTQWHGVEPNNSGGQEDCGQIFTVDQRREWNDVSCAQSYLYLCEMRVMMCSALTVGRLVKTEPNDCVTSQVRKNIKCSFSCPQGYQLQGPSDKQCGSDGQWTSKAASVSCKEALRTASLSLNVGRGKPLKECRDTDECALSNDGCSHKCVNVVGSYKCECPDPGLRLSSDNKTCHDIDECAVSSGGCSHMCVNTVGGYKCECPGPQLSLSSDNKTCQVDTSGVDVHCNSKNMTIIIPKSLLRGFDREHLRLLDTRCKAEETTGHFSLTTPLTGCNTTRRPTPTAIVYSNTVLEIPVAAEDLITRVRKLEISFSCYLSKYGVVSSVSWRPSNRRLTFSDEGKGNFTLSLDMFPDNRFVSPYMKDDFPVTVVLRKRLFFEVSVSSNDRQLSISADHCFVTPTQDRTDPVKYEFIREGCPNDGTVKYHAAPVVNLQRFSLEAFKFIADHSSVFVHCHVIVCNTTDSGSRCVKQCSSSDRKKRTVANDEHDRVYSLAKGPIILSLAQQDDRSDHVGSDSGLSTTFVAGLVILFIGFMAAMGTGLIIFKKLRDNQSVVERFIDGE